LAVAHQSGKKIDLAPSIVAMAIYIVEKESQRDMSIIKLFKQSGSFCSRSSTDATGNTEFTRQVDLK
jgi:hypothetical protein